MNAPCSPTSLCSKGLAMLALPLAVLAPYPVELIVAIKDLASPSTYVF